MALCQSKRPLTFLPRPLGDMFCKSEGLIQSGTHILSYCDDSFAMKLCPPIRTSRYRDVLYRFPLPALESHQPLPAHQQLSSGSELRRSDRTFRKSPRLNAMDNFCAVSSSCAPMHGTHIEGQTNSASKRLASLRVTRSMSPIPGIPPGPSAGVRGNSRRPFNCKASSQTFK